MAKYVIFDDGHFECVIKRGWGAGKIEPQYFWLIWPPPKKVKKTINQFEQEILILGIFLTYRTRLYSTRDDIYM